MKKFAFIFMASLLLTGCTCGSKPCKEKKCKDFKTQKAAQKAFDKDPDCYENLDRDGDGIACESLP